LLRADCANSGKGANRQKGSGEGNTPP